MNLRQLSYFMEVYKKGSIAAAAKSLYITPQGISKCILDLENELELSLFTRKGKKLIPTQEAIALTRHAENLLLEYDTITTKNFINDPVYKTLHIACTYDVLQCLPYEFYRDFAKDNSWTILCFEEYPDTEIIRHLDENLAEFGILSGPLDRMKYNMHHLFTNSFCLLIHKDNPLSKKEVITFNDLSQNSLVIKGSSQLSSKLQFRDFLAEHTSFSFSAIEEVTDYHVIHELADNNVFIGVSLDYLVAKYPLSNCVIRPFPGDTPTKPIYLVSRNAFTLSKEAKDFQNYLLAWIEAHRELFM